MNNSYTSYLPRTPFGGKFQEQEFGNEYELLPELEMVVSNTNQSPESRRCSCQSEIQSNKTDSGDPAMGWEGDNESFTKRSAEFHLRRHFQINDQVQRVYNCCVDIDFFTRRCEFITVGAIKGVVSWSPFSKQVSIIVCVKGQKKLCWYEYFVRKGQLFLRHKKCLNKTIRCN